MPLPPPPKKPKHRSPNYPAIGLEKAVELLVKLHGKYGGHPVPIGMVHELWEYKAGSGAGNQAVAALKSYGLIDVEGEGDARRITVSKDGARVAGNAPDRASILQRAAQAPKIHQDILEHYGDRGLPADDLLKQYLVWDRPEGQRFNPESVGEFIDRFRATLAFSGVGLGDKIENPKPQPPVTGGTPRQIVRGVDVWWCDPATFQRRTGTVAGVEGNWVYVDGVEAGIPLDGVYIMDQPTTTTTTTTLPPSMSTTAPPPNPFVRKNDEPEKPGMETDRTNLKEGSVVLQWPSTLTQESVEELEYWINGVLRRARRKAGLPPDNRSNPRADS